MKLEYVACNLCGSYAAKRLGRRRSANSPIETNIVRCSSCGLIYPNPMPRYTHDEVQNNFNNPEDYFSGAVTDKRIEKYDRLLKNIERFKPTRGRLLDVGCGRGEFAYAAIKKGWDGVGTDISESFARYAREKFGVDVMVGDIKELPLRPEDFDVICLNSVIQYVRDPLGTLRAINSLLKKEGLLYLEVTNEDALVFEIGDLFKSIMEGQKVTTRLSPVFPSFQIYGFNRCSISKALKSAGFKICSIKIKGMRGGGAMGGNGPVNKVLNAMRKAVIVTGGLAGRGHLIYCLAKKEF